ncbi:sunset domain-containing protein [Amycolatopsis orientalis]|uniref:sunset domain-containing protein n=1 Tax=Amycolatopsis orientalis TaxID=31958 RepID=UPI00040204CC|nr:LapA family protein [Amycolatopsis orientalis]
MSIFGQVWLWSLLAFVVGALLTWLVLVLPARKRIRELESSLATAHAETSRLPAGVSLGAGAAAAAGGTAYFTKPSDDELDEEFAAAEEPKPAYPETLTEHEPAQRWSEPAEEQAPEPAQEVREDFAEETAPEPEPVHTPLATRTFEPEEDYEAEYRTTSDVEPEPEQPAASQTQYIPSDRLDPEPEAEPAERTQYIPATQPEPEPEPVNPYAAAATEYLQPASQLDVEPEPRPEPEPEPQPMLPGEGPYRSRLEIQLDPEGAETQPEPVSLFSPASRVETEQPPVETNWFEREEELQDPPAYAFGSDEEAQAGLLDSEPETPAEATQVLPKRTPRGTVRGGFEPPQPIQPSMRAIERREPDLSGGQSGSLFEPAVQPGDAMPAPEPPPARQVAPVAESVPPGPFGPGSAMPRPGGGRPADDFAVKASVTALRYCTEDSPQFPKMVAEVWFRSATDAERVGFRPLA